MSEFRKVVYPAGELIDFETVYEENPYIRTGVPTRKGTIERVDYSTSVYADGLTYNKTCYVYLPYGYDKDDKSKKYNVLYFQHGNTCEPAMFAIGGNKPMFDMIFESGEIEPCIIAFITYYMDPMRDADARTQNGLCPAGDGLWATISNNYYDEVVKSIIPAVETRFNTYLEEATDEGIKATRDHRAFSGYSRGGAMTWRMFNHAFPYFRWFAPMSGMCWGDPQFQPGDGLHAAMKSAREMTMDDIFNYVTAGIKANPELPFFLYVTTGGKEDQGVIPEHIKMFCKSDLFSYGNDPSKNNLFYSASDYYHTDYLVPYYYWNTLRVLFKGV